MPTSRWHSSLSNIEARLRRSLGIAGPIRLRLEDEPELLPVMLVDDLTRPGASASIYRGRRWALSTTCGGIAGGAQGIVEVVATGIAGLSVQADKGGVIVDSLDMSWWGAVTTQVVDVALYYTSPLSASVTAQILDGWMVDPIGPAPTSGAGTYDAAPLSVGSNAALAVGTTGVRIWEGWARCDGTRQLIPLDLFLRESAFLAIGNFTPLVAAQPANPLYTFRGRVF